MKQLDNSPRTTILSVIRDLADVHGDKPALIGEKEQLTYRELVDRSDRYGSWATGPMADDRDVFCLLMPNCPDYVAIWLGLTQIGHVVALINTNLVGSALVHSIRVSGSKKIIVAASLLELLTTVAALLPTGTEIWVHDESAPGDLSRIDTAMPRPGGNGREWSRQPQRHDHALLISTSGTTGRPKAAYITHARILEWSYWFAGMMDCQPEDCLYNCLPMYHSIGGVVAVGSILTRGGSIMIRARFSATRFWDDIVEGDCTIFQYIGELCRYLVRNPPHPSETTHRLRLCCGNGLQGDIWGDFQERFGIPRILEFYAATEGSVSLYNCDGKPGAIGRIPAFLAHRFPVKLIRSDIDSGEPVRDNRGFCVECEMNDVGEAIGQVFAARKFDGYTDVEASSRKLLRDVFVKGDCWFRTGDLMRRDHAGYYYFVDRLGDSFRWKGENVSTTEVSAVILAYPGVVNAIVYGVAVPFTEGRAGMAAITTDTGFELAHFQKHVAANLPSYAHPLFIRLCDQLETTGTFKMTKEPLIRRGISVSSPAEPVWFNDRQQACFIECDAELLYLVQTGGIPL